MANITEIKGNIFNSKCQTIVNCVNCVGVMGKGIALEFKNRYPDMYKKYKSDCDKNLYKPGLLYCYKKSNPWILNFPTKIHWRYPSKMEYIEKGLAKFKQIYYDKLNITSIAFPQLGSSNGGLKWKEVRELMVHYLEHLSNLQVEIYEYDPNSNNRMFDKFKLMQKINQFESDDLKNIIGLTKAQSEVLYKAIKNDQINSIQNLQNLKGLGI